MMRRSEAFTFDDLSDLAIPPVLGPIVDRAGRHVEMCGDAWIFNDDHDYITLDWSLLHIGDGVLRRSMQHYISDVAGSQAPHSLKNKFDAFVYCLKFAPADYWPEDKFASPSMLEEKINGWLRTFVENLRKSKRLHRLQLVRQWYSYCVDLWQDYGFSAETALMLDGIQLPNNPSGVNVHSLDPDVGPLTSQEMNALNIAIEADTCQKHKSIQERAAVRFCMAFGRNPRSFCLLLERYFTNVCGKTSAADEGWLAELPRIKKPNTRHGRHKLVTVYCMREVMEPVLQLIAANSSLGLNGDKNKPLFLNKRVLSGELRGTDVTALSMSTLEFADLLQSFVSRLQVPSRTNGKLLHLTPRRLRYTLGTTLARMGKSREELADMLDHSDTKTVEVYYSFGKDMLEVLDRALGDKGSTLLGYFNKVTSKAEININGRPRWIVTLVPEERGESADISEDDDGGGCGREEDECDKDVPLACYACFKYQPFVEGPHDRALHLVDKRIAAHKHMKRAEGDLLTLRARIEYVIEQCKSYKENKKKN